MFPACYRCQRMRARCYRAHQGPLADIGHALQKPIEAVHLISLHQQTEFEQAISQDYFLVYLVNGHQPQCISLSGLNRDQN